jgi:hypothetical protein
MKQLTVRGFDSELERRLRDLARQRRISLNQAAIVLLRRGAGLDPDEASSADCIGESLDELIGTWTEAEAREFDDAVRHLDLVDEDMWR